MPVIRKCAANGCSNKFEPPATAPHKRFCCQRCHNEWWKEHNRQARVALAAQIEQQLEKENSP